MRPRAACTVCPPMIESGRRIDGSKTQKAFRGLCTTCREVTPAPSMVDQLARLHLAHEVGADDVDAAGFASQASSGRRSSEHERAQADGITEPATNDPCSSPRWQGALELGHDLRDRVLKIARRLLVEMSAAIPRYRRWSGIAHALLAERR